MNKILKKLWCYVFGHKEDWDYGDKYEHFCSRCGYRFKDSGGWN